MDLNLKDFGKSVSVYKDTGPGHVLAFLEPTPPLDGGVQEGPHFDIGLR